MKHRKTKKRLKIECKKFSDKLNKFIKAELVNKPTIFVETVLQLLFGNSTYMRKRFQNNKYIDYRLLQLVYIEQIFNVRILRLNINEN